MKAVLGQVDLGHVLTGLVTTALIGGGAVIWGMVKPEPHADAERAVEMAIVKRDIADLKAQGQRIEEAVNDLRDSRGAVRPAGGKRP